MSRNHWGDVGLVIYGGAGDWGKTMKRYSDQELFELLDSLERNLEGRCLLINYWRVVP